MGAVSLDLRELGDALVGEVGKRLREASLWEHRCVCNGLVRHAEESGATEWSPELAAGYRERIDGRLARGEICVGYHRFQLRVLRMVESLALTGEVDFSRARGGATVRYPVSDEVAGMVEEILDSRHVSDRTRSDLRAPVRHLLWYAAERGVAPLAIDDALVMDFLVNEVPVTNAGSTGRTLRAVRYATEWLRDRGGATLRDYSMISLRNDKRRVIPAYTEAEVRAVADSIDDSTEQGKRDRAIVLLAYCTGLRGCDVLALRLDEIDWRRQRLTTTQSKTHEPITCELNGETMNALADYVLEARPRCGLPEVFVTLKAPTRPMAGQSLGAWFDRLCDRAGVEKLPGRSFHSVRRAFETTLVAGGVAVETASRMVGHKTIAEDKPYITHDRETTSHVAMGFGDVPIRHGAYARVGGDAK